MLVQPYLFFEGKAEEAIGLYKKVLGAKVEMMMRYKENPESLSSGMVPKDSGEKIIHFTLNIGGTLVMGSDGSCSGKPNFAGFSLSASAKDEAEAKRIFAELAEGGQVHQPLIKTFFSPAFGVVADRFGVSWMILVAVPMPS